LGLDAAYFPRTPLSSIGSTIDESLSSLSSFRYWELIVLEQGNGISTWLGILAFISDLTSSSPKI
jgi:hypothetical protein